MKVGWLADESAYVGGAELTQAEFRAAAPEGVQIVDCPPSSVDPDCDAYAIHNCVTYTLADLEMIGDAPAVKYHNDVGPHMQPEVREWLNQHAQAVCCSPLQADYMDLDEAAHIPPPVDLARFEQAAQNMNGNRAGAVCVASWQNPGKAAARAAEWAAGSLDFFGGGPFAPPDSRPVAYEDMPELLARYQTFVFLPAVLEPFGRTVVEAYAAGCRLIINGLVGAHWWIEEAPERLRTASQDYWNLFA